MALSADVARLAGQWLEWDMNPATKAQVQGWIDAGNERYVRVSLFSCSSPVQRAAGCHGGAHCLWHSGTEGRDEGGLCLHEPAHRDAGHARTLGALGAQLPGPQAARSGGGLRRPPQLARLCPSHSSHFCESWSARCSVQRSRAHALCVLWSAASRNTSRHHVRTTWVLLLPFFTRLSQLG